MRVLTTWIYHASSNRIQAGFVLDEYEISDFRVATSYQNNFQFTPAVDYIGDNHPEFVDTFTQLCMNYFNRVHKDLHTLYHHWVTAGTFKQTDPLNKIGVVWVDEASLKSGHEYYSLCAKCSETYPNFRYTSTHDIINNHWMVLL